MGKVLFVNSLVLFVNRKSSSLGKQPAQVQGPAPAFVAMHIDELFVTPCINRPRKRKNQEGTSVLRMTNQLLSGKRSCACGISNNTVHLKNLIHLKI